MIAHVDADAFFASAIVRKNPHFAGKPLLALGMGGGCVIAASYEAKAFGVKTGMQLKDAIKLCPHAIKMPADFHEAARASHEIEAILRRTCPVVEQMSVDEWYLDLRTLVGGIPRDLHAWGKRQQDEIGRLVGLTVSMGVASSKLLAKMAGEYRKPAGVTVISPSPCATERGPGGEVALEPFLKDRPAAAIPGIGRKRVQHTDAHGWKTAWDIAQAPTQELRRLFGKSGAELQEELLGHSLSAVSAKETPPKSVSRCRSFRPTKDKDHLWAQLLKHLEYITLKMRRHDLSCRGISVWLRDGEYPSDRGRAGEGGGANASLPQPAATTDGMLPFVRACFERIHEPRRTYTQVGLSLWHLIPTGTAQYSLFMNPEMTDRDEAMQKSLDALHERFGRSVVTRGSAMAVTTGTTMTMEMPVYD